jgi:Subunit ChlI of Mg-chelatase
VPLCLTSRENGSTLFLRTARKRHRGKRPPLGPAARRLASQRSGSPAFERNAQGGLRPAHFWGSCSRVLTSRAPADVRKEGPSFDLPIALGMLKLEVENRVPDLESFWISGELALSGELRPVKGVLSIALEARRRNR